jgi:heme O synthase-like polyprenyltransferase
MTKLYNQWWEKIRTSKEIKKNKQAIDAYLETLKPGDVTLLGLVTEGGQGLATADNLYPFHLEPPLLLFNIS